MATYSELMAQAQKLMAEAEQARKNELFVGHRRHQGQDEAIRHHRGRPGRCFGRREEAGQDQVKAAAKYKGPNGELWAGGPGRKPEWVRAVLASGKSIESFRI